ncbi:MAG: lipase family protein [Acidimicrobiales bacterium]
MFGEAGARRRGWLLAMVGALALLTAACSTSPPLSNAVSAPAGLPNFYAIPAQLPSTAPGTLVKAERLPSGSINGQVYRVMYLSEDASGAPVVVTGLVMVPHRKPPRGGFPVVSWGHGTNGMADQCAPSLRPSQAVPLQNRLLDQGWVVTASDYQGEGTPGLLPYLVGVVAARNTIDIVRAARHLTAAHAGRQYVVWGHSEGGQTAMFSLAIADQYAPELHLVGVVAGAPPSQFQYVYNFLATSPYRYYLYMAGAGFNAGYGNQVAPLSEVMTPKAISLLPVLNQGCAAAIQRVIDKVPLQALIKTNPFDVPAWRTLLKENDPANITTASTAPLLIIQGGADRQVPVPTTALLEQHECSIGQNTERWIYPGQSHAGVIPVSMNDMVSWIAIQFSGALVAVHPSGQPNVQVTGCSS